MAPRKRKRIYGDKVIYSNICDVCKMDEMTAMCVEVGRRTVCFVCSWTIVEQLSRIYAAPEITALERIKHRREKGDGPKKPTPNNEPGWVYYIRVGDTIKIGFSKDVAQRMRTYPPNAELLAAHPGTLELEKHVQRKFAEALSRGREWFEPTAELMAHIGSVVEQFGDKSNMAYEFSRPKTQEQRVAEMFPTREWGEVARGAHMAV